MEGSNNNNDSFVPAPTSRGQKAPRPVSALSLSQFIDEECDEYPDEGSSRGEGHDSEEGPEGMSEDSDQLYLQQPDVLEYLDQWQMPMVDKISMLRTAANYLTTKAKIDNPDLKGKRLK